MSFILLLMLGMSALLSVDVQGSDNNKTRTKAQLNAILGIYQAIGTLQAELGPDQRISARADIQSANQNLANGTKYWTGVWNTSPDSGSWERGERTAWLVSGDESSPSGFIPNAGVTLVADSTSPQHVAAPKAAIDGYGSTVGGYSWWVGDEGIKARYNLLRPTDATQLANINFSAPHRYGIEVFFPQSSDFTAFIPETSTPQLPKVSGYPSLSIVRETLSSLISNHQHFHDIGFHSRGVLSDVQNGGLQGDLSLELLGNDLAGNINGINELPTWELIQSFLELRTELNASAESPLGYQISPREQTGTSAGVYPVITRFELNLGVLPVPVTDASGNTTSWEVRVCIRPLIVLSNFHDVTLTSSSYSVSIADDPELDSPRVLLQFIPDWVGDGYIKTFRELLYPNGLQFNIPPQEFKPGESLIFTLNDSGAVSMEQASSVPMELTLHNDDLSSSNYAYIDTGHTIDLDASDDPDDPDDPDASKHPKVLFKLRKGYVELSLSLGGALLQEIERIYIARLNPGNSSAVSLEPIPGAPIEATQSFSEGLQATIMAKLPTETTNINNEDLAFSDKRGGYDRRGFSTLANANLRASSGGEPASPNYLWDGNPIFKNIRSSVVNPIQSFDDRRHESLEADYAPIYHIPRSATYSMAELQHLNFGEFFQPANATGNSWADPFLPADAEDLSWLLNRALWDSFFFSGLAVQDADIESDELNPRLSFFRNSQELTEEEFYSTSNLLIEGAFNINSTSVDAWIALLSSLRNQEVYFFMPPDATYNSTLALDNTVLRSESPFGESLDSLPSGTIAYENAIIRGFRSLSDAQIRNLAGQIVYQVKERGPFLSLADFINRDLDGEPPTDTNPYKSQNVGVLQAAIEWPETVTIEGVNYQPTNINFIDGMGRNESERVSESFDGSNSLLPNYPASLNMSRYRNAGGYLTQADLLTLIGSVIRARSDTFRIRSYGEVLNPITSEVIARAWCEAIAQRTPDPLNPDPAFDNEPTPETKDTFGRKFEIVSFRWLTEEEL